MPSLIDSKIANCKSWADFEQLVAAHEKTKDKGDLFERLTQLFLQTSTTYTSKIKQVWWCNNPYANEFPEQVRQKLNLPEGDEGIDLICETFDGTYWSVQAKYRTDNDKALTTKELSKFLSLSFVTSDKIELGLITHTSTKPVRKQDLMGQTTELGLQNFLEMSPEQWEQIAGICAENAPLPPQQRAPHEFQKTAIARAIEHFQTKDNARGKLIMPCGTGKSLMAYWMAREMNAKSIILAVPSLALVKQSLVDWTAEFLAEGIRPEWLAVCSDDSVGSMKEADSTVSTVYEAGIPATTDQFEIVEFLEKTTDVPKVIFTTYQSSEVLAEACTTAGFTAELLIADEAHKTVGSSAKKFATLLSDDNIHINKRLFMTATERVIRGAGEGEVVSMDDVSVYGEVFHQMSFAEAIAEEIICDYKILTLFISEDETAHLVSERQAVEVQQGNRKVEADAHSLAVGLAVEKAFKKYGIKRAITFHSSIKRAENFVAQQREFSGLVEEDIEIDYQTISSKQTAGQRSKRLHDFKSKDLALLSNARCLTEGVDIPSIDCVAFVDPKQSVVDIVQAAGRAMRKSDETGKGQGYILIPISVPLGVTFEEFSDASDFKALTKVIAALSTQDERIAEELQAKNGSAGHGRLIIDGDFIKPTNVGYSDFSESIKTELWKAVGRANFLSFQNAREYVRALNLETHTNWLKWLREGNRPTNLPSNPDRYYKLFGWKDWPDFLGSENIANSKKVFATFEEARKYAQSLGFKSSKVWRKWARTSDRPSNIPSEPHRFYSDQEWQGWPDFLGNDNKSNSERAFMPFEEAKRYARELNLPNTAAWHSWAASKKRPDNIPSSPHRIYLNVGWTDYPDFLGTNTLSTQNRVFLDFEEARKYARSSNIQSSKQWQKWAKTDQRPANIPSAPAALYYGKGWKGWPDFLGTKTVATRDRSFLSFEEARKYAHDLGLKSSTEWRAWAKTDQRPENIPSAPYQYYKGKGWNGYPDFLGTKAVATKDKVFLDFEAARKYALTLNFTSSSAWFEWSKTEQRPSEIPSSPHKQYAGKGWKGWSDFLGTGKTRPGSKWQREEDPET